MNITDYKHPDYIRSAPLWRKVRDACAGEDAIKAAGERYLPVDCVPGCFFAARDDALRAVGYLDERTFLYQEETKDGSESRFFKFVKR